LLSVNIPSLSNKYNWMSSKYEAISRCQMYGGLNMCTLNVRCFVHSSIQLCGYVNPTTNYGWDYGLNQYTKLCWPPWVKIEHWYFLNFTCSSKKSCIGQISAKYKKVSIAYFSLTKVNNLMDHPRIFGLYRPFLSLTLSSTPTVLLNQKNIFSSKDSIKRSI
jgi:hypothetical protein